METLEKSQVVGKTRSAALGLWGSNLVSCLLVVINTLAWGYTIHAVGLFTPTLGFFMSLGLTPWFYVALGSGFVGLFVVYHGQVRIGIAKAALFYNTGTVALLITSHFLLNEAYSPWQLMGAGTIMAGGFLVSGEDA